MKITTNCCGCGVCANACTQNCIEMTLDAEGFLVPTVNMEICVHCGICEKVCPINQKKEIISPPIVIGAFSKEDTLRYESSSGGVFSVLATEIINQGGVVCGVEFDSISQNARHIIIDKIDDLEKLRGSKYIQSEVGDVYINIKKHLLTGRKVLFSGTPCQVAGLRSFLRKDYDNLLCVEVICHGVPSTRLWEKYIQETEKRENKRVINVLFRNKKYSWSEFGMSKEYSDLSQKFLFSFEDPFFQMFNSNLCLRKSCYKCEFKGLNTKADISLGDFWHVDEINPKLDDGKGISIVLLCTNKGINFFNKMSNKMNICIKDADYETACRLNSAIVKPLPESDKHNQFFEDMQAMTFKDLSNKYFPLRMKQKIKGILLRTGVWRLIKIVGGEKNCNYGILIIMTDRRERVEKENHASLWYKTGSN